MIYYFWPGCKKYAIDARKENYFSAHVLRIFLLLSTARFYLSCNNVIPFFIIRACYRQRLICLVDHCICRISLGVLWRGGNSLRRLLRQRLICLLYPTYGCQDGEWYVLVQSLSPVSLMWFLILSCWILLCTVLLYFNVIAIICMPDTCYCLHWLNALSGSCLKTAANHHHICFLIISFVL